MNEKHFHKGIRVAGLVFSFGIFFAGAMAVSGASLTDIHFLSGAQSEIVSDNANQFDITSTSTTGGVIHIRTRATGNGLYIDTANNVGIGNTSPGAYRLSVTGSTTIAGDLNVTGGSIFGAVSGTFTGTTPAASVTSGVFGSNAYYRFNNSSGGVLLYTDATNSRVGVGTASPTDALTVAGYVSDKTGRLSRNLLDTTAWTIGIDSVGSWSAQQTASGESQRVWGTDPFGRPSIIWNDVTNAGNDASGGFAYSNLPIDANKAYRYVVWVKRVNATAGSVYLGADTGGNTINLNGTANSNPYFFSFGASSLTVGRWYMLVGYMHANNDASVTNYSTVYDGVTGQAVITGTDFKNAPGATTQLYRTFAYYNTAAGTTMSEWGPRFEEINGSEPSIESLLGEHQGATNNNISYFGGNVGVGTSTPAVQFHVYSATTPVLAVSDNTDSSLFEMTTNTGNEAVLAVTGNHPLRIYTNGSERMRVAANGNVGIGNASPTNALDITGSSTISGNLTVSGTINGALSGTFTGTTPAASVTSGVFGSNAYYQFNNSGGTVLLYTDATNSRVGIGNAAPARTLDVTGAIRTSNGQLYSGSTFNVYTDANGAQVGSFGGLLIGTSYDTTPAANQIRTSANQSLTLNARGTGVLVFSTADTEKVRVANNGRVGIGASTLDTITITNGNTYTFPSGEAKLRVSNASTGVYSDTLVLHRTANPATHSHGVMFADSNSIQAAIRAERTNSASNYASDLQFYTAPSGGSSFQDETNLRMVITSAGSVGIGTSTPSGALDVASAATTAGYWLDGKAALTGEATDNWLRLNQNLLWGNGVYVPSVLRVDGEIRQGSADAGAYGIQTGSALYAAGTSRLIGQIAAGGTALTTSYNSGIYHRNDAAVGIDSIGWSKSGGLFVNAVRNTTYSTGNLLDVNNMVFATTQYSSSTYSGALTFNGNGGQWTFAKSSVAGLAEGTGITWTTLASLDVNGVLTANSFSGTYSGTIPASSVTTGTFGSNANYRFNNAAGAVLLQTDATNGRVGIGTATPGTALEVNGDIYASNGTSSVIYSTNFKSPSPSWGVNLLNGNGNGIAINTSGYVGIGATPVQLLTVGSAGSAANAAYSIGASTMAVNSSFYSYGYICANNAAGGCTGAGGVVIGPSNTSALISLNTSSGPSFFNGGNVGIGTTNPASYKLEVQAGTGQVLLQSTNDSVLLLKSTDTWTGIAFDDSGATNDYIWYNGANGTFAIGGGGANISGKKLHVDGGMTIGANYDTTAMAANGLSVEGNISNGGSITTNALSTDGSISNLFSHGNNIDIKLPAARNGGSSGDASLRLWVSEPSTSWTGAAIARNMTNSAGLPRINTGLTGQMIRFGEGTDIYFTSETAGGTRYTPLTLNANDATFAGTVTAASFSGSATDSTKVAKTGDTMTGPLTIGYTTGNGSFNVTNNYTITGGGIGSTANITGAPSAFTGTAPTTYGLTVTGGTTSGTGCGTTCGDSYALRAIAGTGTGRNYSAYFNGSVGIGTLTPSTALQVNGTVTATQFNGSGAGLSSASVPIASLAAGDYSGKITSGIYSITGAGGGLRLGAGNWSDGGATYGHIATDNSGYKALMIVGNNVAGNSGLGREVKVWDYLNVQGDVNATSEIRTGGTVRIDASGNLSNISNVSMSGGLDAIAGYIQSSLFYSRGNINILNKAANGWLTFATRDTSGADAMYDLAYIDKLDANLVDPPYTIGGKKYATYMAGMTGVKEETTGIVRLAKGKYVLNLEDAAEGSDLWLFNKTTNLSQEGLNSVTVLLTPNFNGKVWYEKDKSGEFITIYGSVKTGEVSYRLTAPRFDHENSRFVKEGVETYGNRRMSEGAGMNLDELLK